MISNLIVLVVILICSVTDIRSRKIYNSITVPAMALGLLLMGLTHGWQGLLSSSEGLLLGIGLLFIPFAIGGIGAGDVKLLGAVGALKGMTFVFTSFLYGAAIGGGIALFMIWRQKRMTKSAKNMFYALSLVSGNKGALQVLDKTDLAPSVPYGVAIAAGVLITFLMGGLM